VFSPGELDILIERIKPHLTQWESSSFVQAPTCSSCGDHPKRSKRAPVLTPQKVLVILGVLGGVLEVDSILFDRNQVAQILLQGSLKRETILDKILDEIGSMPFDDVLRAVLGRVQ